MSTIASLVSVHLAGEGKDEISLDTLPGKFTVTRTDEALTPYGGLAAWSGFLKHLGIIERLADHCPVARTSPNAAPVREVLHSFLLGALVEGKRFCHVRWVMDDPAVATLMGMERVRGEDALPRLGKGLDRDELRQWLHRPQTELYGALPERFIADWDSTVNTRYGHQEDAAVGYNPHKHGRKSHHPLICVAARTRLCLHLEWRPGDTVSATDWQPAMEKLWSHPTIRERLWLNRGDVGSGILVHLVLRFVLHTTPGTYQIPLLATLVLGGLPLLYDLLRKLLKREFGSDLLGGISIITSVLLGEYLAGSIIVLMLAGGEALESYALRSASSVLAALAKRMPSIAHRKNGTDILDVALADIAVNDTLVIYPHDICPVDGVVVEGHGVMDESYLTGEPFQITKTSGSNVISGAINGESALTIRATQLAADSRYAKIMEVMRESESKRPQLQRLGDRLGAIYTPVALSVAILAWAISGEALRFLAVLVIATPCPLLIGIPIAIIGSISLCARRAIIVKNAVVLEQIAECRTAIFDKTGTLTYGEPKLTEQLIARGFEQKEVLTLVASLERYSKHPLARAILAAAKEASIQLPVATEVGEQPGQGLLGTVSGHKLRVTSRKKLIEQKVAGADQLPPVAGGLECVVVIDERYAAALRFRDAPRAESRSFVKHLGPKHHFERVMLVSGDRESEVHYLAEQVGITEIHAEQSPEQKLALVRAETAKAKTLYVGDGINDAPAMMAATVGMAIGQNSDVTAEAAGVVIMDNSLEKVDEFMHISRRMRTIALQSAVGGMALSVIGMVFAATGHLTPVAGAITQEVIDVLAVLNALRAALPPKVIHDL